ncbi:MAG: HD domain-containing protein [Candidatus Thorarchaeota archaeon]
MDHNRPTMKRGIEERLRKIVEVSTRKAASEEWRKASKTQKAPLYNYRLDHIEEVVVLAKHIAEGSDADMEVLTLAAWLHDLAKPGVGGIPPQQHGIVSAEMAEEILTQEQINRETIEKVSDVIRKHVGLVLKEPLKPLEAQILWEADKILKLGMIGFIQGLLNGVRLFPGRSISEIADGLHEFVPLASEITQSMVTKRGKELAQQRFDSFRQVSKYLDGELKLGK